MTHGGKRPNQTGRPPRAGTAATMRIGPIWLTPTEHTLILSALTPPETPAGFLRAAGLEKAGRRVATKRKAKR